MKRLYSLALVAMMAMCAMVVASCGDDDDETPDTSYTFTVLTYTGGNMDLDAHDQAEEAAITWIKEVIGVDATFKSVVNSGFSFTITKDRNAVIEKIKNADTSKLDAALAKIGCLYLFKFTIDNDESTLLTYNYELNFAKYYPGTWKGSLNGVTYTLTISASDNEDAHTFDAVLNDGTQDYPSSFACVTVDMSFGTEATESDKDGVYKVYTFLGRLAQEPGTISGTLHHGKAGELGTITFTKQ